ncbi:MEF2D factor, partial [Polyodon spathula]|nr:MEF2D factor [Polyodon spathula]
SAVPPPSFSVSNQNTLQFSNPSGALVTSSSFVTSSLSDPRLLSPQQPALQRNTVSPGLPQRPASAGALLGGDLNNSNGQCPSPVGNGYMSARASPGLLSVSNGNSLGKVVPAKSPPPPGVQMGISTRKPDLRVITSQNKGLLQLTEEDLEMNAQRLGISQVAQPLTTPMVSVATPSLLTQGLPFSATPTAYTDYQLTSADISALQAFTSPGGLSLGNLPIWQQQQQQQQQQQLSLASLSNLVYGPLFDVYLMYVIFLNSMTSQSDVLFAREHCCYWPSGHLTQSNTLSVNTNPNISIKSEPASPNRDRSTPCSSASGTPYPGSVRLEPTGHSPVNSLSSNGSSYEGSDRDDHTQQQQQQQRQQQQQQQQQDFGSSLGLLRPAGDPEQDSGSVKRMRMDTWVT